MRTQQISHPNATKNLTADEYARACKGYRARLEMEERIFWDPDVVAQDRLAKDMLQGKWPYRASSGDRPKDPDLDPFEKMCEEAHESCKGQETPYQKWKRAQVRVRVQELVIRSLLLLLTWADTDVVSNGRLRRGYFF